MKKFLCSLLVILTISTLAACSNNQSTSIADNINSATATNAVNATLDVNLNEVMKVMKSQVSFTDTMDLTINHLKDNYWMDPNDVKQFAALTDTTGIKADRLL